MYPLQKQTKKARKIRKRKESSFQGSRHIGMEHWRVRVGCGDGSWPGVRVTADKVANYCWYKQEWNTIIACRLGSPRQWSLQSTDPGIAESEAGNVHPTKAWKTEFAVKSYKFILFVGRPYRDLSKENDVHICISHMRSLCLCGTELLDHKMRGREEFWTYQLVWSCASLWFQGSYTGEWLCPLP